jgi:hypothetical protein
VTNVIVAWDNHRLLPMEIAVYYRQLGDIIYGSEVGYFYKLDYIHQAPRKIGQFILDFTLSPWFECHMFLGCTPAYVI